MQLSVNRLIEGVIDPIESTKRTMRILRVEGFDDFVACIDVNEPTADPEFYLLSRITSALKSGEAVLLEHDTHGPKSYTPAELEAPDKQSLIKFRDRAMDMIGPLITGDNAIKILFKKECTKLIKERASQLGIHPRTVRRLLRRWWQGGQVPNTLLGKYDNCGGKGKERTFKEKKPGRRSKLTEERGTETGVAISKKWLTIIYLGIELFLKHRKSKDLKKAYRTTLERFCPIGTKPNRRGKLVAIIPDYTKGEVFSPRQFEYRLRKSKKKHLRDFLKKQFGERKFNLRYRELKGDSTSQARYPGALYQIDATIADVNLANRRKPGKILGRPVIVVVIDVFSRMIVGFCVRLEREGWLVISLALKNATEDKVAFCQKYGIEITEDMWMPAELCDYLTGDRGPMMGYNATNLVEGLKIDVSNTPPYRADWKGIVEQVFHQMNIRVIHDLPAALPLERERGDRDVRLDALLDLGDFIEIIIEAILYHNNKHYMEWYPLDKEMIEAGVKPIPRELYVWGLENRTGRPRYRDPEQIRIHLLPEDTATFTSNGIKFRGEYYTCEQGDREGWDFLARNTGRWKEKIAYDPRVPEIIYLRFSDGSPSIPCFLKNRKSPFHGADFAEIEDYIQEAKFEAKLAEVPVMQAQLERDSVIGMTVANAKIKTKMDAAESPNLSRKARTANMRADQKEEIAHMHEQEAREILESEGVLEIYRPPGTSTSTKKHTDEKYIPRAHFDDVLELQDKMMEEKND